jgi:hypothetical protein
MEKTKCGPSDLHTAVKQRNARVFFPRTIGIPNYFSRSHRFRMKSKGIKSSTTAGDHVEAAAAAAALMSLSRRLA